LVIRLLLEPVEDGGMPCHNFAFSICQQVQIAEESEPVAVPGPG
jgi:hypothetical protein